MGSPDKALELLINDDVDDAQQVALVLDAANTSRREEESRLLTEALVQAQERYHGQKILIVAGEDWHEGIKGIVASRLVKQYGVPVIVFSLVEGEARGSGRSIGAVNLFKAVERCSDLLVRFGGHEAAVGLTVSCDKLDEFTRFIETIMKEEPDENFHPPLLADAELLLGEINVQAVEQLAALEPFGQGNREPLFVSRSLTLERARTVGAKKNHLSFTVTDNANALQGIWFNCPAVETFLDRTEPVDIVYRLQLDEWNGRKKAKLMTEVIYPIEAEPLFEDDPALSIETLAEQIVGKPVTLHGSQIETLKALAQGESALAVMATGRGKSLIFQIHAARLALSKKRASLFVFPLRALIADQLRHVTASFARVGLEARALTGECSAPEKDEIFKELYEGSIDVLLTTPEFLYLHAWRFAQSQRIGFIVFDEAHHIHHELIADRTAYYRIQEVRKEFTAVQYLAVTATADDVISSDIKDALGLGRVIIDTTRRENLQIDDARNREDRDSYLTSIVERGNKSIIYVNSRAQAVTLTRIIRKDAEQHADAVAFYHAGLTRPERMSIEKSFREGELKTIISTSAFGEGINIPDVSSVILYHLPFNIVAFNQMAGRAGRDGETAHIHLLYSQEDAEINRSILEPLAPSRETLVTLFRILKQRTAQGEQEAPVLVRYEELSHACRTLDGSTVLEPAGIKTGIAVFAELGLLSCEGDEEGAQIRLVPDAERVELSSSSLYLEGRDELELFERFKTWALNASALELREQITGPLIPVGTGQESKQ
jgi:single-stranded-DNA-specific exonuclease